MDVSGASSLSMASLSALFGQALSPGAAGASGEAGATMPALAMEAAALATGQTLVAALMDGMTSGGSAASLAQSLASLSVLDPAAELARLTR